MTKKRRHSEEEENEILESIVNQQYNQTLKNVKIELKFKNKTQKSFADKIENKEITICSGLAGTGKTFVACAQALKLFKSDPRYRKIYIIKSVTTLKDEEIGYLKGTLEEKMEPFVYSFIHNFEKIIGKYNTQQLRTNGSIEIMPIAYLRGINFDNCIILIDECQNLTKDHLITIVTRIGTDAKMVLMGDTEQIDKRKKVESGFSWVMDKCKSVDEIGIVSFDDENDIVRNPIIIKFLEAIKE